MEFIILIARPDRLDSDLNDRITFFSFMAFLFTFLTRKRLPHKEKSQASLRRLTRGSLFLSFCLSLILFFFFPFLSVCARFVFVCSRVFAFVGMRVSVFVFLRVPVFVSHSACVSVCRSACVNVYRST